MKAFLLTLAVSSYVVALGWNLTDVRADAPKPYRPMLANAPVALCGWTGEGYIATFDDTRWEDSLAEGVAQ